MRSGAGMRPFDPGDDRFGLFAKHTGGMRRWHPLGFYGVEQDVVRIGINPRFALSIWSKDRKAA